MDEVSHTGRWVAGQGTRTDGVSIVDRRTGAVTPEPADGPRWFIRDNPVLRLNRDYVAEYPKAAVYLRNVATGSQAHRHRLEGGPAQAGVGRQPQVRRAVRQLLLHAATADQRGIGLQERSEGGVLRQLRLAEEAAAVREGPAHRASDEDLRRLRSLL